MTMTRQTQRLVKTDIRRTRIQTVLVGYFSSPGSFVHSLLNIISYSSSRLHHLLSAWHQRLPNWSHTVASDRWLTHGNVRLAGSEPTESSHPERSHRVPAGWASWYFPHRPLYHPVPEKTNGGRKLRNSSFKTPVSWKMCKLWATDPLNYCNNSICAVTERVLRTATPRKHVQGHNSSRFSLTTLTTWPNTGKRWKQWLQRQISNKVKLWWDDKDQRFCPRVQKNTILIWLHIDASDIARL